MEIAINSVKFKTDVKLEKFIESKVSKLILVHDGIYKSEVTLKLDKDEQNENKITEIKINLPGVELFAKKRSKSFEEGTDLTIEALRKQLVKHKNKTKER
ncbi:MAG: 30S ribosomal protein S30 [Bacteroidetes bacterium CG2_30_33_31]|nr:MAG: 30S ribosomal protein S30 [Bacteroidetes bacterium CG2_30_33_31]